MLADRAAANAVVSFSFESIISLVQWENGSLRGSGLANDASARLDKRGCRAQPYSMYPLRFVFPQGTKSTFPYECSGQRMADLVQRRVPECVLLCIYVQAFGKD